LTIDFTLPQSLYLLMDFSVSICTIIPLTKSSTEMLRR
jgi:hypothetical protein